MTRRLKNSFTLWEACGFLAKAAPGSPAHWCKDYLIQQRIENDQKRIDHVAVMADGRPEDDPKREVALRAKIGDVEYEKVTKPYEEELITKDECEKEWEATGGLRCLALIKEWAENGDIRVKGTRTQNSEEHTIPPEFFETAALDLGEKEGGGGAYRRGSSLAHDYNKTRWVNLTIYAAELAAAALKHMPVGLGDGCIKLKNDKPALRLTKPKQGKAKRGRPVGKYFEPMCNMLQKQLELESSAFLGLTVPEQIKDLRVRLDKKGYKEFPKGRSGQKDAYDRAMKIAETRNNAAN